MERYSVRVLERFNPSPFSRAIRVEKPADFHFDASQSVRLILGPELQHPMTIASGPERPHLDFAVQRSESDFKRAFFALQPGDTIEISAPRGQFFLERAWPALMIASGIGITPFRSMLQALYDERGMLPGVLVHATRAQMDVPFRDEIDAAVVRADLRLVRHLGAIPEELLRALKSEHASAIWYLAGPVEDVKQWRAQLESLGVDKEALRLEAFRYPGSLSAPISLMPDWEELYRSQPSDKMPWFYPELDPDVARALQAHPISGRALDIGSGPGTQAIALAERGFTAIGIDISAAAVQGATERAQKRGVQAQFVVDDILATHLEQSFDLMLDRGCFHVLRPEQRADYVRAVAARCVPRGFLFLKCFADDQPGQGGPHRFAPQEITAIFGERFEVLEINRTVYQGTLDPMPRALFCVLRKKPLD